MSDGWWALTGVVVGGAIAGLWQWLAYGARRRDDARRYVLDLVSEFLADVDVIWRAAQTLDFAVQGLRYGGGMSKYDLEGREFAADLARQPTFRSAVALMKFDLVKPELRATAEVLLEGSRVRHLENREAEDKKHGEDLDGFLAAVTIALGSSPRWARVRRWARTRLRHND